MPPLTYKPPTAQRPIAHTQNQPIEYNHVPTLTYEPSILQRPIEQMQTIEYNQPTAQRLIEQIQTTNQVHQKQTDTQQLEVAPVVNQPRASYNRPIGYEENLYLCNLCDTPTKFSDKYKLCKHRAIFHLAFDKKNKGKKRGNDGDNKISPKKIRWNGTKILADDVADADTCLLYTSPSPRD